MHMMQDAGGAGAPDQSQQVSPDDQIINQIGALLQQLSPDKQKQVIAQLEQLFGVDDGDEQQPGAAPAGSGMNAPEAGPNGVPSRGV